LRNAVEQEEGNSQQDAACFQEWMHGNLSFVWD
jgi:hypothetical protein